MPTDKDFKNDSNFHLPNFDFILEERKTGKKWGGILIHIKNDIKFKVMKYLSVSDGDNECVTVEIENKNSKYLLITCCYRPPGVAIKVLTIYLTNSYLIAI